MIIVNIRAESESILFFPKTGGRRLLSDLFIKSMFYVFKYFVFKFENMVRFK